MPDEFEAIRDIATEPAQSLLNMGRMVGKHFRHSNLDFSHLVVVILSLPQRYTCATELLRQGYRLAEFNEYMSEYYDAVVPSRVGTVYTPSLIRTFNGAKELARQRGVSHRVIDRDLFTAGMQSSSEPLAGFLSRQRHLQRH